MKTRWRAMATHNWRRGVGPILMCRKKPLKHLKMERKSYLFIFLCYQDPDFTGSFRIIPSFQIIMINAIASGYFVVKLEQMAKNSVKMPFFHHHLFLRHQYSRVFAAWGDPKEFFY